jgi:hypothetical protein
MANPRKAPSPKTTRAPSKLSRVPGHAEKRLGKGMWTIRWMGKSYKRKIHRAVGIDGTVVRWVTIKKFPVEVTNVWEG